MKYLLTNLETERLTFRLLTRTDFETWLPFFEDRSIYKYLWLDETKTDREVCEFWFDKCLGRYKDGRGGLMAVIEKSTGKFLGQCGLLVQKVDEEPRLEVGYSFLPDSRGHGYATEAAVFAKNHAFRMKFDQDFDETIFSMVHNENSRSAEVAKRNGMTHEKQVFENNQLFDIFSINRETWLANHGA